MRPRLLMCSAASFDLTLVVMTESFTKATGCERSISASSAASAMTGAERLAMTRRVVTILDFMAVPCKWLEADSMRAYARYLQSASAQTLFGHACKLTRASGSLLLR